MTTTPTPTTGRTTSWALAASTFGRSDSNFADDSTGVVEVPTVGGAGSSPAFPLESAATRLIGGATRSMGGVSAGVVEVPTVGGAGSSPAFPLESAAARLIGGATRSMGGVSAGVVEVPTMGDAESSSVGGATVGSAEGTALVADLAEGATTAARRNSMASRSGYAATTAAQRTMAALTGGSTMSAGDGELVQRVRRRLVREGQVPSAANVTAAVRAERGDTLAEADLWELVGRLRSELTGAGPLTALLADPQVTDVLVNGGEIWVDRGDGLAKIGSRLGAEEVGHLTRRLAALGGRRFDDAHPWMDARLPDGTRVHAIGPPVTGRGICLSLRTFRPTAFTIAELLERGTLTADSAVLLTAIVRSRLAFLVTGGAGSGKTTLLAALLGTVAPTERIILVEDTAELRTTHPHVVSLAARPPNAEGAGEVTLRDLVRQSLRMRPDRIVIGECRGAEVVDLLAALNTGHDGGAGTLHANAPADTLARLAALAAFDGLDQRTLEAQVRSAIQVLIHVARRPGGRLVETISVLTADPASGDLVTAPAWRHDNGPTPGRVLLTALLTGHRQADRPASDESGGVRAGGGDSGDRTAPAGGSS